MTKGADVSFSRKKRLDFFEMYLNAKDRIISYMRLFALIVGTLFIAACSTTRNVHCEYAKVADVLKKRFVFGYDEFKQTKPEMKETPGVLHLYFESPVDFFYGVNVSLLAKRIDDENTSVSAKIIEDNRTFWGYTGRSKELEKSFLDVIEKRLNGEPWEPMPWRRKKKDK